MTKSLSKGAWPVLLPREEGAPPIVCPKCGKELSSLFARSSIMHHLENVHSVRNARKRTEMTDWAMLVWRKK